MRVRGNCSPNVVDVSPYEAEYGRVELRIRENISEIEETDTMTGELVKVFEYDEYTFIMDDEKALKEKVESNIDEWFVTGRTLEVSHNATLYVTAKADAIDEFTTQLIEEGLL